MRRTFSLMALTLLMVACGEVEVSLFTEATEYRPGDTVELELQNQGTREVGYNLCAVRLERQDDAAWTPTPHRDENEYCQAILHTLEGGAKAQGTLRLPSELRSGEYRIVHDVDTLRADSEGRSVQEPVTSNPFLVHDEGTP